MPRNNHNRKTIKETLNELLNVNPHLLDDKDLLVKLLNVKPGTLRVYLSRLRNNKDIMNDGKSLNAK